MENQEENQEGVINAQETSNLQATESTAVIEETQPVNNVQSGTLLEDDLKPNFPLGIICGLLASIIGGILWAVITVTTGYQIGYMAIAIGLMVGYSIRFTGRGNHIAFGIIGAALSLFGCILGNYFSVIGFSSSTLGIGIFDAFSVTSPGMVIDIMKETFSGMDVLFYGIAMYEGFKFSMFMK